MEEKKEQATERFQKMYNCCHAVACTYCEDLGIREQDMFRMTEGFGSGIGGLKDTCGAAMGMFLTLSLANSAGDREDPCATKMDTYAKFLEAAEAFQKERGSLYCRDLKKMCIRDRIEADHVKSVVFDETMVRNLLL